MAKPKKVMKPSSSQASATIRRKAFAERYLVNGNNATEAAKFVGCSPRSAHSQGHRLLNDERVKALLGTRAEKLLADAQLSTERWAKEMACIGHFDPGELYDAAGNLIPIHELPEHVRRAISSVDKRQRKVGKGEDAAVVTTTKVTMFDKNTALANIGKHLGMFERDNMQKAEPVHVTITLVGRNNGPARRPDIAGESRVLDGTSSIQGGVRG